MLHKTSLAGEAPAPQPQAGGGRGRNRGRESGARGTIAAVDERCFVRMPDALYCFVKKD